MEKERLKRSIFHFRTIEISESSRCRNCTPSNRGWASIHARFLVTCPRLGYRAKYFFAERARAQQDDSLETRGGLSLSLPHGRSLSHRSCPLRLSNDALLPVSTRISHPIRGIFPRAIHKSPSQWISSVFESLKYHEIQAKPFHKKSCRRTILIIWSNFQFFQIVHDPQTIAIIISFIRIIFPCTDSFEDGWNNFLISTSFLYYSEQNLRVEF